ARVSYRFGRRESRADDHAGTDPPPADFFDLSARSHHFALLVYSNHYRFPLSPPGHRNTGGAAESDSDWSGVICFIFRDESDAEHDLCRGVWAMVQRRDRSIPGHRKRFRPPETIHVEEHQGKGFEAVRRSVR